MDFNEQYKKILHICGLVFVIIGLSGCSTLHKTFVNRVKDEFVSQPVSSDSLLTEEKLAHLPLPVKKYIILSGAVGKSIPRNFRLEFSALMIAKPGAKPMKAQSIQYNFFTDKARIFFMTASKLLIPFRVLHTYRNQQATMVVRIASLFNVVNASGSGLTEAETVTLLNDMCLFAPGSLIDKRLNWKELSPVSAEVALTNGQYKVKAILYFNDAGELIDFYSEDRSALQPDGTLLKAPWSTPVKNYQEYDGIRIPTYGETIWHYKDGDFTYGKFTLKSIEYNVRQ